MLYKLILTLFISFLFVVTTTSCNLLYTVKSDTIPDENQIFKTIQQRDFYIRSELLLAQIDIRKGRIKPAYNRLLTLDKTYPENFDIQIALINLESFMGLHLKALDRLNKEVEKFPDDRTINAIGEHITDQRRSNSRFEERHRYLNKNSEAIRTLEGNIRLTPNIETGIRTVLNYVVANDIQLDKGISGDFTAWKRKYELFGSYEFFNGTKIKLSLHTNENNFGGGFNLKAPLILGGADFFADLNMPVWDFTEGVLDQATVTHAGMQQFFTIGLNNRPMVRFSYNRYHIKDVRNVSESFSLFCIWRMPMRFTGMPLFFEYGLGAEYVSNSKRNTNGSEHLYYPLINREVHYATIGLRKEIFTQFIAQSFFEIYLGWAYDRFGENGPQTGIGYQRQLTRNIELKLFGSYGAITGDGTNLSTGFSGTAGFQLLLKI